MENKKDIIINFGNTLFDAFNTDEYRRLIKQENNKYIYSSIVKNVIIEIYDTDFIRISIAPLLKNKTKIYSDVSPIVIPDSSDYTPITVIKIVEYLINIKDLYFKNNEMQLKIINNHINNICDEFSTPNIITTLDDITPQINILEKNQVNVKGISKDESKIFFEKYGVNFCMNIDDCYITFEYKDEKYTTDGIHLVGIKSYERLDKILKRIKDEKIQELNQKDFLNKLKEIITDVMPKIKEF